MSTYEVIGTLAFREHKPGEIFEAVLDPVQERRALNRGNIRLLEVSKPTIQPGSYTLPRDWSTSEREVSTT